MRAFRRGDVRVLSVLLRVARIRSGTVASRGDLHADITKQVRVTDRLEVLTPRLLQSETALKYAFVKMHSRHMHKEYIHKIIIWNMTTMGDFP